MIEFIDSRRECNNAWFVSFASRKAGADIEANNCTSFVLAAAERGLIWGATFAIIASNAGYTAPSLPLLPVIKLYMDYPPVRRTSCALEGITHNYQVISISSTEGGDPNAGR